MGADPPSDDVRKSQALPGSILTILVGGTAIRRMLSPVMSYRITATDTGAARLAEQFPEDHTPGPSDHATSTPAHAYSLNCGDNVAVQEAVQPRRRTATVSGKSSSAGP
jgi:hypothetical protein